MAYAVEFAPRAERQFRSLPRAVQIRLKPRIDGLADNPNPPGSRPLSGAEGLYRLGSGDYRVIHQIKEERLLVLVVTVGHRRDVYRRLAPP